MNETNLSLRQKCGTRIIDSSGHSRIAPLLCREDFDNNLMYSENKSPSIKGVLNWNPMDEGLKERCKENFWFQNTLDEMKKKHPSMDDRLFTLREHLLSFAGESVCLSGYEHDLTEILDCGQFWIGNNIKMMRGIPSQCHSNSCDLWEQNKEDTRICTGYTLSKDGMWRQHSWLVWMKARSNQIVETTVPRIAYFGFVMTTEQCKQFCEDNFL